MRRILLNDKNEFSYSGIKISERHQIIKKLGKFFESNCSTGQTNHKVVISNKANLPPNSKQHD